MVVECMSEGKEKCRRRKKYMYEVKRKKEGLKNKERKNRQRIRWFQL